MSYLLPIAIFLSVLAPVLVPAAISCMHAVIRWQRTYRPAPSAVRHAHVGRLLVPAAA